MRKNTATRVGWILIFGWLAGCGNEGVRFRFAQEEAPEFAAPAADAPPIAAKLRNTHYYTIFETDYSGKANTSVLDVRGRVLAKVPVAFYKDLLIEGSGKLKNGKVLNFGARVGGKSRYEISPNPWGNGVGRCVLVPFRTVAVDKRVIPLGSVVYIDQTDGMLLPDGTRHDGVWRADDVGSAIQRDRVDLYIGKREWNNALSDFKIDHLQALDVRILKLPDGESCAR